MLHKDSVLNAHDICGNPIHREAEVRKSPVHDHEVPLGHNYSRFVLQRWRDALDEIEQTLTTRRDMSAVLNILRRPIALSRHIISFVEESVKSLKNECFVLFLFSLAHCLFPFR